MDQLEEFDIREYVDALKRRWWVIASALMLCSAAALAYSFVAPKIYESSAKVLISAQQDTSGTGNALTDPNQLQNQMQTQVQIAESEEVKAEADRQLGAASSQVKSIKASGVTNTRVMQITAQSEDPQIAQHAADVYSQTYLQAGARTAIDRVSAIAVSVNQKKAELQTQIDQLNSQDSSKLPQSVLDDQANRKKQLQAQIDQIQRQYDGAQAQALVREASAAPFAVATSPKSPVSPQPLRNVALALTLGALIGIGIALAWERFDDRLRTTERFARWFPNYSVLASIPRVGNWKNRDEAKNITLSEPRSVTAEAYRGLRTSLDFMSLDQEISVIEITSAGAGEGKSTTVSNLATAMAWAGRNVIVMNADLRRPRVHRFFGSDNSKGITSVLLNRDGDLETALNDAMQTVDVHTTNGTVRVLGTGELPPNPSELLGSVSVRNLVTKLREMCDILIIDAPPILPVSDPLVLSQYADGVVFIASATETTRKELDLAFSTMEKSLRCPILGVVINDSEEAAAYSSRYDYSPSEPTSANTQLSNNEMTATTAANTQTANTQLATSPAAINSPAATNEGSTRTSANAGEDAVVTDLTDHNSSATTSADELVASGRESKGSGLGFLSRRKTKVNGTTKTEPAN